MSTDYDRKHSMAATRLRRALSPQTDAEHRMVEWLMSNLIPNEIDAWSAMVERTTARVRVALHPDSQVLEARMDRAAGVDSEVVRHLRHLLGVAADQPSASSLERDQEHGQQRRGKDRQ